MPPARADGKDLSTYRFQAHKPVPRDPPPPGWGNPNTDLHLALGCSHSLAEFLKPGPLAGILGLPALQLTKLPLPFVQLRPDTLGLLLQLPDALAVLAVQGLGCLPWKKTGPRWWHRQTPFQSIVSRAGTLHGFLQALTPAFL